MCLKIFENVFALQGATCVYIQTKYSQYVNIIEKPHPETKQMIDFCITIHFTVPILTDQMFSQIVC